MNLKGGYILHDLNWAVPEDGIAISGSSTDYSPEAYQLYQAIHSGVPVIIHVDKMTLNAPDGVNFVVEGIVTPILTVLENNVIYIPAVDSANGKIIPFGIVIDRIEEPSATTGSVGTATLSWAYTV